MARTEMNFLKSKGYKSQNSAYDVLTNKKNSGVLRPHENRQLLGTLTAANATHLRR